MADALARLAVAPEALRRRVDPESLPFATTAEAQPLETTIGQPRAMRALELGVKLDGDGYNVFVSGLPGSGRESTVLDHLRRAAADRPRPDDWLYVYNFADPDRPRALHFPAGQGREFAHDLDEFVRGARELIPRAFESEEYARRRSEALRGLAARRDELTQDLAAFARERSFAVQLTPMGLMTAPARNGRPLSPEEIEQLSPEERAKLEELGREVGTRAQEVLGELRQLDKAAAERTRRLNEEIAVYAVGPLLEELREKYGRAPGVLTWLRQLQEDLPKHLPDFRPEDWGHGGNGSAAPASHFAREEHLQRYRANLVVDHAETDGAPIVVERNPTYYNLIGRIDYRAAFPAWTTSFHEIKAGSLLRANGGFLVLPALPLLQQPFAWDALKRALRGREIRIENLSEQFSFVPTATIRPQPIPLSVKVVVVGPPLLYHLLLGADEDFRELFKVRADFAPEMDWNGEGVQGYASFVRQCVEERGLRHFDRSAVARLIEHGGRLRESQLKLSTRLLEIADIVTEASFFAGEAGRDLVAAQDVERAIDEREYRSNLIEERIRELIARGTIAIDTEGARTGQVNGLSVLELGDYRFGRPARVTARTAVGRGDLVSIEREIELSGPIHSKGFLILSGYLAQQYAQERPLALRATLTFEQSYDEVEGDSASSTELYALLSALSGLPLKQGIAVTGSVNQHGEIQAVGGVNEKIEGFYAVCKEKGLTGEQGVVIPRTNVPHLMLREEVVEAVREQRFHVWAVATVDEGIELLTGVPAGTRGEDGAFPPDTVHALVEDRLRRYAEHARAAAGEEPEGGRRTGQGSDQAAGKSNAPASGGSAYPRRGEEPAASAPATRRSARR